MESRDACQGSPIVDRRNDARRCADHLKSALLELGGKALLIVLDDADLECAVTVQIGKVRPGTKPIGRDIVHPIGLCA